MDITFNWAGRERLIRFDGTSYQPISIVQGTKNGQPSENERTDGYFRNIGGAIKKIIDTEFGSRDDSISLHNYIDMWNKAVDDVLKALPDDLELG